MRPFFFKAGLVCALCFTTLRSLSFHQAGVQCRAAVLNVPRNSISIFVRGRKAWVWSEQVLTPDQIKRFVAPAFLQWRINSWKLFRGNAFEFANRKFLVGDHVYRAHSRQWCDSLPLDYAIITASEIIPEQFLAMHKPHCLILSRSLSFSKRKQWQEACQKKNITCYNIVDKGAFVVNLEPLPLSP